MKNIHSIIPLALLAITAACNAPETGRDYRSQTESENGFRHGKNLQDAYVKPSPQTSAAVTHYPRAGYYDRNGGYIAALDGGPHVPARYIPSRGMCQVWFISRTGSDQPKPQLCGDIHVPAPDGSYVIFGG